MADRPGVPLPAIRRALAEGVERHGLRAVARAVGISHPSMLALLDGAEPRAPTLRKLVEWFVRDHAARGADADAATSRAALSLLLRHLPEETRDGARRELLAALERASEAAGVPAPRWLTGMRDE
jgi:AcrR family transcriptional regulator